MQEVSKACSLDDDMADGDLGDGMGVGAAPSSTRKKSQSFAGVTETLIPGAEHLRRSSQTVEAAWIPGIKSGEAQHRARWKLSRSADSLLELSKEELKDRLQEASEVIDVLCCELEVTHRYLEGKYEALRILQGKAILDKATSHTKSLVQKSEERAKALEKLAVLGACRCLGTAEACPCSRTAAASRKQLVQLQQELDDQCSRKEEALMVADAFRIAFEQQLRKRSEHFLRLAEANGGLKPPHYKAEGKSAVSTVYYIILQSMIRSSLRHWNLPITVLH
ncbi:hypothetical protein GBF38_003890 [Nibea albiflora]|uniref:Uncharacterized protein n=1 Tax=Nibea albiflora TaxID=240163 RepID=A0ACB7FAX2_NIBAL|nr:hypothetical protein GBF38_003890 [Nibea albiflora]